MTILLQGVPIEFSGLICLLIGFAVIAILALTGFGFPRKEKPKPHGFDVIIPEDRPPSKHNP